MDPLRALGSIPILLLGALLVSGSLSKDHEEASSDEVPQATLPQTTPHTLPEAVASSPAQATPAPKIAAPDPHISPGDRAAKIQQEDAHAESVAAELAAASKQKERSAEEALVARMTPAERKAYHVARLKQERNVAAYNATMRQVAANQAAMAIEAQKVEIYGEVFQAFDGGILVDCYDSKGTRGPGFKVASGRVLIRGMHAAEGARVHRLAFESGFLDYQTVLGAKQRVRAYRVTQ